jgi:hypothetical protein
MSSSIISSLEVFNVEYTVPTEVNLIEDLLNQLCSELIHRADDDSYEIIIRNLAAAISVKSFEEAIDVFLIYIDLEIVDSFPELINVQ